MKKHYKQFRYEGFRETYVYEKEVKTGNPDEYEIPEGCSGVRFFDRNVIIINGKEVKGKKMNVTGWYYNGESKHLEDVKEKISSEMYQKMQSHGYRTVVITLSGKIIPLRAIDSVIMA